MAAAVSRNVVFRTIEGKWRGSMPCSGPELLVGAGVGLILGAVTKAVFGLVVAGFVIALLVGLRKLDHDRSDYVRAFARRFEKLRAYNANEPDLDFVPFDPR